MSTTRRGFVSALGAAGAASLFPSISARGMEASRWNLDPSEDAVSHVIRIDSNENPNGPGGHVLDAIRGKFGEASRYGKIPSEELRVAIAKQHGVSPDNVQLGCGSTDILRMGVYAYTSPTLALVSGGPTFEDPGRQAEVNGAKVRAVPVRGDLKLDLDAMILQCDGAGLVFLCNPNNPTATVHGKDAIADFVSRVLRASPGTTILIDEAYHEYVEDPAYATAIPLAMENPRVIVSRTFSKVYGMAGLRIGYAIAHPDTIKAMARYRMPNAVNTLGAVAAVAALNDTNHIAREQKLNHASKEYTRRFFVDSGYNVGSSDANFLMIDIKRDSKEFQEKCKARGVLVGRQFPPLLSYARISIGTMGEMRKATEVFKSVLLNG